MNDLTQGSVIRHVLHMAAFMAVSMFVQTLYLLADLYWVGHLGKEAIAAVGLSGNLMLFVIAITQSLAVGTSTLIAHAAGRKHQARALTIFNQSFVLSLIAGAVFLVVALALRGVYANDLSADALTGAFARQYLAYFLPALALQFPMIALGAALRGSGVIKPTVGIQVMSVLVNMTLAPLLIFGVGPFPRMGVAGAALSTLVSILFANVALVAYFERKFHFVRFNLLEMKPRLKIWWEVLRIGLPAGAEFSLLSFYLVLVYAVIRPFGAAAQAGFGVGARVMQSLFLPTLAIGFALAPVVGQNFGAKQHGRVREAAKTAGMLSVSLMLLLTVVCHIAPAALIRLFTKDAAVGAFGSEYLRIISYNFVAVGLVYTAASVFEGLGKTLFPLLSSSLRIVLFAVPVLLLSRTSGFEIRWVWLISVASVLVQAATSLLLLRMVMKRMGLLRDPAAPRDRIAANA